MTTTEFPSAFPTATAKARFVRVSPTKARRVIDLVRGKSVADAQEWLAGQMKHWETVTSAVKIEVQ